MADSLTTFLHKTTKMGTELIALESRMALVAAQAVKTSVTAQMALAGVTGGKLRGVGRKGAKIGVRYDLAGKTALVRATGPFHLIERDTKAHRLGRGTRSATSGLPLVDASGQDIQSVVTIPGVGFRAWANHPGTQGKHPWVKGVVAAMPIQQKAQAIALHQALKKAYTGG